MQGSGGACSLVLDNLEILGIILLLRDGVGQEGSNLCASGKSCTGRTPAGGGERRLPSSLLLEFQWGSERITLCLNVDSGACRYEIFYLTL